MLELRELDLHLAFVAARALRKDIEDQARAVDHAAVEPLLEIALLHRREIVIENRDRRVRCGDGFGDFLDLAFAGEERRIGTLTAALDDGERAHARARRELFGFCEAFGVVGLAEIETDQDRLAVAAATFGHQERRWTDIRSLDSWSAWKLTGRAGTTVEIACL